MFYCILNIKSEVTGSKVCILRFCLNIFEEVKKEGNKYVKNWMCAYKD